MKPEERVEILSSTFGAAEVVMTRAEVAQFLRCSEDTVDVLRIPCVATPDGPRWLKSMAVAWMAAKSRPHRRQKTTEEKGVLGDREYDPGYLISWWNELAKELKLPPAPLLSPRQSAQVRAASRRRSFEDLSALAAAIRRGPRITTQDGKHAMMNFLWLFLGHTGGVPNADRVLKGEFFGPERVAETDIVETDGPETDDMP